MNKVAHHMARILRDAKVEAPQWSRGTSQGEDMRAFIVRDMAREFRNMFHDFDREEFFDLCDLSAEQREPRP